MTPTPDFVLLIIVGMTNGLIFRRRQRFTAIVAVAGIAGGLAACQVLSSLVRRSNDKVSFSRDIRPILNQNCVACHGGVRQKNGVSFIFREEALGVEANPDVARSFRATRSVRIDRASNFDRSRHAHAVPRAAASATADRLASPMD